jgi:hypothetical protein
MAEVLGEKLKATAPTNRSATIARNLEALELSPREQYLFETAGFVVVPDAIPPRLLAELNAALDANQHRVQLRGPEASLDGRQNEYHSISDPVNPHHAGTAPSAGLAGSHGRGDFGNPLHWELPHRTPFQALATLTASLRWMLGTIGDEFWLVDAGGFVQSTGAEGFVLHGRGRAAERERGGATGAFYRWEGGRMRNGLMAVSFCLSAVGHGDGGFCCIPVRLAQPALCEQPCQRLAPRQPCADRGAHARRGQGSHKSELVCPLDVRRMEVDLNCVVQPAAPAGAAIIFSEALTRACSVLRALR